MKLIDGNKIRDKIYSMDIKEYCNSDSNPNVVGKALWSFKWNVLNKIMNSPEIESEEKKYGNWIIYREAEDQPRHMKCSYCGQYWSDSIHAFVFKRCFTCGAIMVDVKWECD